MAAVGTVGWITTGKLARNLLEDGPDLATVAKPFLKNLRLVWTWTNELGAQAIDQLGESDPVGLCG
jgi:2,4-dienoyl-CoA reductase-like NADH-dependent reductase (Old Yellow Enzyme family)